ncbi:MAG: phosphoribosylamine--glycine ligase [Deltaproteobacteria bacterium]|nr:phosphoribosylamine--glycine ligase [Deltaproteobacteria bacterium]
MKVLVIGSGGREHALVWKIRQSPRVSHVLCAPGNAGIGELADLVSIAPDDIAALARFARDEQVDLTVVGPELPLTMGIVDEFQRQDLRIFGPSRDGAQLEGSKAFTKDLLRRHEIPTGFFSTFTDADEAKRYISEVGPPIVVKADGLAAGKGVLICTEVKEAHQAVDEIMVSRLFGDAGQRVVIEEFLEGEEVSFIALTDGRTVVPLASSQDHKRAFDGDSGPNTGGMGAYSPAPAMTAELHDQVMRKIMQPVVDALRAAKIDYRGVLYAGLMMTEAGPKVLEFNSRFGDPECQPLMMRLRSDVVELMEACIDGRLDQVRVDWDPRAAACVVLAAAGYPGNYEKGKVIRGLDGLRQWTTGFVFHAGTAQRGGQVVTNGGRVLGVTALGTTVDDAVAEAYRGVAKIQWDGMHFRSDIGHRAIAHGS